MLSFLNLDSFKIFNIFLFFIFSVVINNYLPLLLSTSFYCIFYLFIVYMGFYHYRKILYLIFFVYGLFLDIFLINEIGPHLLVFIFTLFIINFLLKYLSSLSSIQIFLFMIFLQILMLFMQMFISYLFFSINFNFTHFIQIIFIISLLSYPIFLFFIKLDKFK